MRRVAKSTYSSPQILPFNLGDNEASSRVATEWKVELPSEGGGGDDSPVTKWFRMPHTALAT